nr:hypothetical protein Iba_chr01bCG2500 [Ipomoea batatas]
MPSENNCIMEDVDNEVNILNPYDFNDSDSFDSSSDDENCFDTCENNAFVSLNDNDGFDLNDLNDIEFVNFHNNCLDDAIYIHDLLGEEKEETDGDLRDLLLSSEKEEEKESVNIEKENEEENFENEKVLFGEVHGKIIEEEKEKTRNESVREQVDEKLTFNLLGAMLRDKIVFSLDSLLLHHVSSIAHREDKRCTGMYVSKLDMISIAVASENSLAAAVPIKQRKRRKQKNK